MKRAISKNILSALLFCLTMTFVLPSYAGRRSEAVDRALVAALNNPEAEKFYSVFRKMRKALHNARYFNISGKKYPCNQKFYWGAAFVSPKYPGEVFFCPGYYSQPMEKQIKSLAHEMVHLIDKDSTRKYSECSAEYITAHLFKLAGFGHDYSFPTHKELCWGAIQGGIARKNLLAEDPEKYLDDPSLLWDAIPVPVD